MYSWDEVETRPQFAVSVVLLPLLHSLAIVLLQAAFASDPLPTGKDALELPPEDSFAVAGSTAFAGANIEDVIQGLLLLVGDVLARQRLR